MRHRTIVVLPFLIVSAGVMAYAQMPHTLSYQGTLSDTTGIPKPDVLYSFTYSFYETGTGGSPVWTDQ